MHFDIDVPTRVGAGSKSLVPDFIIHSIGFPALSSRQWQKGEKKRGKEKKKERKENAISRTICGVCGEEDAEMTRDPPERKESEGREVKYMARDMYYVDYIYD